MSETKPEISFEWNEEYKIGTLWVEGSQFGYPGYDNERQARREASKRLAIMRKNLGLSIPRLPPKKKDTAD